MLLGVVWHVTIPFTSVAKGWWIAEYPQSSESYYYLYFFLKSFRMPLFFVIAGFFANMLYARRGLWGFAKHRAIRIVIPLIMGLLTLVPIIHCLYIYRRFHGNIIELYPEFLDVCVNYLFSDRFLSNFNPAHLWFLYYLILLYVIGILVSLLFSRLATPQLNAGVDSAISWLIRTPVKPFLLAVITTIPLYFMSTWNTDVPSALLPLEWHILLYYGIFFAFGWLVYRKAHKIDNFTRYSSSFVALAAIALPVSLYFQQYESQTSHEWYAALKLLAFFSLACLTCFTVFGLVGVFHKFLGRYNRTIRYVSDSSYWLYLIHLPIVMYLQVLFADCTMSSIVKFLVMNSITFLVCIITYNLLVRYTFIGSILNGPKHRKVTLKKRSQFGHNTV